ncbi:TnsD family Tn7-like transposition protein [Falsibacillus pallidus]|uniref:TniQ protein n=1 Tax=Falsibacillus pallidus TaxID=493781 RepID=A0A370G3D3_9BACI|nr:TnsD family Tn7-like transposition protein [Falsibacillus pallidus]RDI37526.1 TniQ protein [Falsibacillus pallidus]
MICCFPTLYDDEMLFSVIARYHKYSGNENPKHTSNEIFGMKTICATTVLPANLNQFSQRIPDNNKYTPDQIIENHTLFPYYSPFIPEDRYLELVRRMREENGASLYMKLGRVSSNIKSNDYLKYCSQCVDEELNNNGEAYWHRTHQVEGVKICSKHLTELNDSNVFFSDRKHKHAFIPLETINSSKCNSTEVIPKSEYKHHIFIAEQTYFLLNNNIKPLKSIKIQNYYLVKLKELGLVSVGERIRWKELIPQFNDYYGKEFLQSLNCYVELDKKDNWLHKLLRKSELSCHPLRHILFLGFLGETIHKMVSNIDQASYFPFGRGPWLCLNRAAPHFREPIINSCSITRDYKSGDPVGTFTCSCGFVYSRKGPDKTEGDQYKIGRIKCFGSIWEEKAKELKQSGFSLRNVANILGVDSKTVKKHLTGKLENMPYEKSTLQEERKQSYRSQWTKLMSINKESSITELRHRDPKTYMWLYRNDKEWLIKHSCIDIKKNTKNSCLRIDWEKRDAEMSVKVEPVVGEILKERYPFVKVTKNEIFRRLNESTCFSKNLNKLPLTQEALNQSLETTEQFQIRRIKCVVAEMRKTHGSIKVWKVIRSAGLKSVYVDKLKSEITEEIEGLKKKC